MSETLQRNQEALTTANRRLHVRQPFLSIAYVELGDGNGGVIANISEGGLAVQAAMALVEDSFPCIRFQLGPARYRVQTGARVTWRSDSKKSAGLQFQDLPEEARAKISEYISLAAGASNEYSPPKEISRKKIAPQVPAAGAGHTAAPLQVIPPPESPSVDGGTQTASSTAIAPSVAPDRSTAKTLRDDPAPRVSQAPDAGASPAPAAPPTPARLARTRLKRYLVNERARILLHDFALQETEKLCAQLTEEKFPSTMAVSGEECLRRMRRYEQLCEVLIAIISTGCFWGEEHQEAIWAKLLERVANAASSAKSESEWRDLSSYPALLLLYAGGVAAVAKGKYSTLATLLSAPQFRDAHPEAHVVQRLNPLTVLGTEKIAKPLYEQLANGNGRNGLSKACPGNAYLHAFLREPLREFLPFDWDYDEAFDRFEYSLALIWTDENPHSANLDWFPLVPLGRFACLQSSSAEGESGFIERVGAELLEQGKNSPLLHAGLFGGSLHRLTTAKKLIEVSVAYSRYSGDARTAGPGPSS